jgi:hypothetical protein
MRNEDIMNPARYDRTFASEAGSGLSQRKFSGEGSAIWLDKPIRFEAPDDEPEKSRLPFHQ